MAEDNNKKAATDSKRAAKSSAANRDEKGQFVKKDKDSESTAKGKKDDGKVEIKVAPETKEQKSATDDGPSVIGHIRITSEKIDAFGRTSKTVCYDIGSDGAYAKTDEWGDCDKESGSDSADKADRERLEGFEDICEKIGREYPASITVSGRKYYSERFVDARMEKFAQNAAAYAAEEINKAREVSAAKAKSCVARETPCDDAIPSGHARKLSEDEVKGKVQGKRVGAIAHALCRLCAHTILGVLAAGLIVSAISGLFVIAKWFFPLVAQ